MIYRLPRREQVEVRILQAFFASMCLLRGLVYTVGVDQKLPPGIALVGRYVPIWVWGLVWLTAALCGLVSLSSPRLRTLFRRSFSTLCGLIAAWFFAHLCGWIFGGDQVGYGSASIYGAVLAAEASFLITLHREER